LSTRLALSHESASGTEHLPLTTLALIPGVGVLRWPDGSSFAEVNLDDLRAKPHLTTGNIATAARATTSAAFNHRSSAQDRGSASSPRWAHCRLVQRCTAQGIFQIIFHRLAQNAARRCHPCDRGARVPLALGAARPCLASGSRTELRAPRRVLLPARLQRTKRPSVSPRVRYARRDARHGSCWV
jgi:hypothetical protein